MRDHPFWLAGIICLCISIPTWAQNAQPGNSLQVQVSGLPEQPLKNIMERLSEKQANVKHDFTEATILRFYRNIPKEIKRAIQPYGYFKPQIRSYINQKGNFWFSNFLVTPGPRLRFTTIDFKITGQGAQDPVFQRLYAEFPIKVGAYFNSKKYNRAKEALFNISATRGYFKAKMIKSVIHINLNTYESHVTVYFNTGPRYSFGNTTFSKTPFNENLLNRFLTYKKGAPYNRRKVEKTRRDLANSNYFQQVIMTPEPDKATDDLMVPIDALLHPQTKKHYSFGVGYGTDTGFRGLIDIDYRWLNQYGDRFHTYLRGAQTNSNLIANYYIPGSNPATDQYVITGGFLNQNQITGQGESARFGASYQTVWFGWQQSFSLMYLHERYNLKDFPRTIANIVYPTYTIQRLRTDRSLNPRHGYRITGQLTGASEKVLSETSFFQSKLDAKFLMTVFKPTRLIVRASAAKTDIKDLLNLPLSLQLFAGGADSLRGYRYNSIGPGTLLVVGSVEVQQRIFGKLYLVGFYDVGNVSNNISGEKLKQGVGPGLAYVSPVGVFELTVANAISQPNRPWVIQFSMGPVL